MKKTNIIALFILILGGGALILSSRNLSTYATFDTAIETKSKSKIVGQLSLSDPIDYNPEKDPNRFSFFLVDQEGVKKKVIWQEPKPRDFERSEQIVVTGRMSGKDEFLATEVLLKCPSKYKDEELALRSAAG